LLPLVPLLAFLTWFGILEMRPAFVRNALTCVLLFWCLAQFSVMTWAIPNRWLGGWHIPNAQGERPFFSTDVMHGRPAPPGAGGVGGKVIEHLARRSGDGVPDVLLLVDDMYHNENTLDYEAFRNNFDLHLVSIASIRTEEDLWDMWREQYDFVLYREPVYDHFSYYKKYIGLLSHELKVPDSRYRLAEQLELPVGGTLDIYAGRGQEVL